MKTLIAPACWPLLACPEAPASQRASETSYRRPENVRVLPVVIPELELGNVEGEILLGDVMERAENAAIQERPEAVNSPSVDIAPHVFATDVRDAGMLVAFLVQLLVKPAFVCGD